MSLQASSLYFSIWLRKFQLLLQSTSFAEIPFKLAALELLKGEWNFRYHFAVLFQDEATLEGTASPRAYSLGHDSSALPWLSEQNERECFEKAVLTFG